MVGEFFFGRCQTFASSKVGIHICYIPVQAGFSHNQGVAPMGIRGHERKNNVTLWECTGKTSGTGVGPFTKVRARARVMARAYAKEKGCGIFQEGW